MVEVSATGRSKGSIDRARSVAALWVALALALVALAGMTGFQLAARGTVVTVTVDGHREQVRSTRPDVASMLADLGLRLRTEDRVEPEPGTPLADGQEVTVERARPALVLADGMTHQVYTRARTVGALLEDAGIHVYPNDEVWLEGRETIAIDAPLPALQEARDRLRLASRRSWSAYAPTPLRLSLRRAVPMTVEDDGVVYTIHTTAPTVGEALLREHTTLYLGDRVQPSLGSPVRAGIHVLIQRSNAVLVTADGRTVRTRTRGKTVGDALTELGIAVTGNDRVEPGLAEPMQDNASIRLVRVQELIAVEARQIPFASIMAPSDDLEIDSQRLDHPGAPGEWRRRSRLVYEDGVMKTQSLVDEWVAAEPITRVLSYGRKIVSRSIETPQGTLKYWRKIRMRATAYSKSTAGVPVTVPWFGITRSGLPMRKGIVGVDPSVIPWLSRVYVPNYGIGLAADTGSAIRARLIDLGYDDDNLQSWYTWTWVYLLDPPPPAWQIRWVIPNWPPPQ